jgi:uncharacterized repeat protein (TIGR01451 family)
VSNSDHQEVSGWQPHQRPACGTLLEGAVFEVYDKAGNKVDTIRTDHNGRAVSKLLPLSRYTVREVSAPAYYAVNPTVMTAYLEYEDQIVTFEVLDSSVATGVSITKTGPKEVMPGQPIRYTLKDIANTSTVPLSSFYWRDTLPGQMTLSQIITGTYNQQLSYKVVYKTNLSGTSYRTLADNLSTGKNYVLDARPAILKLASNERITEVMSCSDRSRLALPRWKRPPSAAPLQRACRVAAALSMWLMWVACITGSGFRRFPAP